MITKEYLDENYYYALGFLFDKKTNKPIGTIDNSRSQPYLRVKINRKHYYVHRLIFLLLKGYLPKLIDHKDRNSLNNMENNLRDLSHSKNLINKGLRKDNTSGFVGITWHKKARKYEARIKHNKQEIYLGLFNDIEEAIKIRQIYENKILNHNTTQFVENE